MYHQNDYNNDKKRVPFRIECTNCGSHDATATAFCLSSNMPIHVFGLKDPDDIIKAIDGECVGTVVTAE